MALLLAGNLRRPWRIALGAIVAGLWGCDAGEPPHRPFPVLSLAPARAQAVRDDALVRAQVWQEPVVPIEQADFLHNPSGPRTLPDDLECRYLGHRSRGATPKVHCVLPSGEVLKVKYGDDNAEVFGEVAASRLLRALGFGADEMYTLRRVRCSGCPPESAPWPLAGFLRFHPAIYEDVTVERRFPGSEIRGPREDGWAWFELDHIDPGRGGAPRAHVDALRLMAVLLAHWDNKSDNQRLVCLPGAESPGGCAEPFALVHDVGASFGPFKMDVEGWRAANVWRDRSTCRVSLTSMPYGGGTFPDATIGEAGRRFLGDRLARLSDGQLSALFLGARFPNYKGPNATGAGLADWVRVLREKIRQVADGPPCPQ